MTVSRRASHAQERLARFPVRPITTVTPLLLSGFLLLSIPTPAQMVNDPSETMLMNKSSLFVPLKEEPVKAEKNDKKGSPPTMSLGPEAEKTANGRPGVPSSGLEPELDLQKPSEEGQAASSGKEPLKARAVMVDITSNTLNYDKDHDVYIATGSVHMVISEQNSELYADKMTYDQNQDLVIAEGSVTIVKDGQKTHGSDAKIDLSRKSALINDYLANVEKVRIKAKQAFVNAKYVQYENGRIILSPALLQKSRGLASSDAQTERDLARQSRNRKAMPMDASNESLSNFPMGQELDLAEDGASSGTNGESASKSNFNLKVRDMDIYRTASGYDKIYWKRPSLYYKGRKIAALPNTEFSMDEPYQDMEYLGPDIGYDPDYGGFYAGPGWDFHTGQHGNLRISPLVSYGGSGRRSIQGGSTYESISNGPGIGAILHYRDPKTRIDGGYNSHVGNPVVLARRKLFDGKTQLMASANEDYINGFLGYERPRYGLAIQDTRQLKEFGKFQVSSHASAGYYKDEFFPNYNDDFFVKAKEGAKPVYAGRGQVQLEFSNTEPLLRVGKVLSFGVRANAVATGYTTGDFYGLIRGGPTMNIRLGQRYNSSLQYFLAATAGDSPFIFDSYYRGRQNLVWSNAFAVNKYLTLGMRSNMSLNRDNDQGALFTGNQLFMMVGPKEVKVNLAYDVIRKRSYFGLNFYPGNDARPIDFEKMRIFQPENYSNPVPPP